MPPVSDPGPPTDEVQFTELTNRTLDADGDQSGLDTYELIRGFGGDFDPGPIEAPDLYPINHPEVQHILKAVGGSDIQPILTVSGAERSGEDGIEVRQSPLQDHTVLARTDWGMVTGEWLEAYCRVTFADSGDLRLIVTRMRDDAVIFNIDETGLDLWRGEDASHFVRPKWGIYRSILDLDNPRPVEENVRFANFSVSEVMPTN